MNQSELDFPLHDNTNPRVLFSRPGYNTPPPLRNKFVQPGIVFTLLGCLVPGLDLVAIIIGLLGIRWAKANQDLGLSRCRIITLASTLTLLPKLALIAYFYI
ncbi:hypothetical protein KRX54_02775 [Actinomycetaceae bacterium TAE3-ERU4]|nr:hypothetical protein [Actinomycetaceae bacterium TAE3-ERU4]